MILVRSKIKAVVKDTPWVVQHRPEAAIALFLAGYLIGYFVAAI